YIAQKEYIFPPRPSMRLITDQFSFCLERVPKWNTISISGYHIREAGSTALQELAFTLRDGIEDVEDGVDAGLQVAAGERRRVAPTSLHTTSLDETLALPTDFAVKLALRTQQVIAYESGVANTIDPLGGSYFVEELTTKMERGAFDYFRRIDALGGMVEAIEAGFPQREIMDAAYA